MMHYPHFSVWITIFVLTSVFQTGISQNEKALICTNPVVLEIGEGQIETLQIVLENAKNIYGIDIQATFDPTVVQIFDSDTDKTGIQMTSGGFLRPDFTVRNTADNKAGALSYVVTQVNPTPPANGKGVVLLIQFRGKASGTRSKFTITSAVIADRRGIKQPVTIQGADLVIVPQKPPTPTPFPTTTLFPVTQTLRAATIPQAKSQPTTQLSTTVFQNLPAIIAEREPFISTKVLTYVTAGGFAGAILLSGLSIWFLAVKLQKEKAAKSK